MGATSQGKSCLAAIFAGYQLEVITDEISLEEKICHTKNDGKVKLIGEGDGKSFTKVPYELTRITKENEMIFILDCPGFFDTEGIQQEIANSFYNNRLMENIDEIKFIFVSSENTLME